MKIDEKEQTLIEIKDTPNFPRLFDTLHKSANHRMRFDKIIETFELSIQQLENKYIILNDELSELNDELNHIKEK